MSDNTQEYFTRRELAQLFRVSPRTVIRWEQSGALASIQLGPNAVRYTRSTVSRFIAQQSERCIVHG
jgi:excisionase family DNA binding protein